MICQKCGYAMDPFDKECPRCHGQGVVPQDMAQATAAQPAPVPQPAPVQPAAVTPVTPTPSAPSPPSPSSPSNHWLILYVLSGVIFSVGYLAPWITISFMGVRASVGGSVGLEFLVFLSALIAVVLALCERFLAPSVSFPVLRTGLSATCLVFAAGETLYLGLQSNIVQIGFGLPLMVLGAGAMATADFVRLPRTSRSPLLPLALASLIAVVAWSGYKGYELRRQSEEANQRLLSLMNPGDPGSLSMPNLEAIPTTRTSKARDDVEVTLHSSHQASTMPPEFPDLDQPFPPDPGKVFLVCNRI